MAGDSRDRTSSRDEEIACAIFEVSRARTLLMGVTEALPKAFQMYASDIEQLLDAATARLRWVRIAPAPQPDGDAQPG